MQDIIIFGTGKVGRDIILLLKNEYNILFLADNEKSKWGNSLEGYIIKSPDEIRCCDCGVVVASTKYGTEMTRQLQAVGINRDRIYLCGKYRTGSIYGYEIYPLDARNIIGTGKRLNEYDLLNTAECGNRDIKVMVFCTFYSTYTKQLIENMSGRYDDIEFSLITNDRKYKEKIVSGNLKHIYCFQTMTDLKTILEELPEYDAMQLLWIENKWAYFHELIRKKTRRLNLNVGGSDFYRSTKVEREYKRELIKCADQVTAETIGTIQDFESYYSGDVHGKIGLLPFGIEVLDLIKRSRDKDKNNIRKKYHIPFNKVVVTCGHNASEAHQHMDMIDALSRLSEHVKREIVCVFPMAYPSGRDKYINEVDTRLDEIGLQHVILTDFMDFQSMAEYALISDIMIHVQTTDQLSSTMLEEMYAGSIVIAGSWLPYQSLHEMGIYFLDVDTIPDVTAVLEDVVMNIESHKEKCAGNSEIVWQHSSWDVLAPKWHALWD